MSTTQDRTLDEVFSRALELAEPERECYVRSRCAGDTALERAVRALIAAADASDEPLARRLDSARENLWRSDRDENDDPEEDLSGQCFHPWQLVRRLARGGLATVYLAQRADGTFEQTVAFKVLRRGLDTDDLVARFRAERQMLSALDHPSIAKILDGGALPDGRPYLVLEYVDGLQITDWCEENRADIRTRLRLLISVLQAVHHAHRHLIVHRDIKPSNILVSQEGHVSLLDFGIAKLLDPSAVPGASTLTRTGVALLTPGYGSPEQCAGDIVTTASDIHQVGQVMYELLTGQRPGNGRLPVTDAAVLRPSLALRGTAHFRSVRGDLDAIACKAMHADPAQRYASAIDMLADLECHLEGRPVRARPDTLRYRIAKLHQRRPWLMPAVAIGVLAVAVYVVTLTTYARQLQIEQRRAASAQSFLVDMLRSADPFAPADPDRGREITVVEALDLGMQSLRSNRLADPQLRASLLATIASVYRSLDQYQKAIALREEALALERELHGEQSRQALDSLAMLAGLYRTMGDYPRATRLYDEQLAIASALFSVDDPALGSAEAAAAEMQHALGELQASRQLYEDGIRKMQAAPREYSQPLIGALVALAGLIDDESPARALIILAEAQSLAVDVYGAESLAVALVRAQTATQLSATGDHARAEAAFHEAITLYESRIGRDHGATLAALNNLGSLYLAMGEYVRGEELLRDVLSRAERKYGSGHRQVANAYQNLATHIARQGRYADAIPVHRRAYEIYRTVLTADHEVHALPLMSIAYAELQLGEFDSAESSALSALAVLEKKAPDTYLVGVARCLVGLALEGGGEAATGAAWVVGSHALLTESNVTEPYRSACRLPAS